MPWRTLVCCGASELVIMGAGGTRLKLTPPFSELIEEML
jgi:hypothetical protein